MAKFLKHFFLSLAVVIFATSHSLTAKAGGIPVGVSGDLPEVIEGVDDGEGTINFNLSATFSLVPTAPPWLKQFIIPAGTTIVPGQAFPVWEELTIVPNSTGLVITDWHEEIHETTFNTPFMWSAPLLVVHDTGEEVTGVVSTDGQTVDFDPILSTGGLTGDIDIWIHKELIYTGNVVLTPSASPLVITVWEEPTVPEPSTLILAAFGMIGLAFYRITKKR